MINTPIAEEHPDNRRFLEDIQRWLGVPIHTLINKKYPDSSCMTVWTKRRYMSGPSGAVCTYELKKEARYDYQKVNTIDYHVLGFTAEESNRYQNFILSEQPNTLPILIEAGLAKQDCFNILQSAGIQLPEIYHLGFPNANCIGCVKAASATYWNLVRRLFPDVFRQRADLSRELGVKLVKYKGRRMFLDELPENAKARPLKSMRIECGLFCEPEKIIK